MVTKAEKALENARIKAALVAAFKNRPQDFEWNGEVVEGDPKHSKCACGHPIRWMFIWTHKTDKNLQVVTGSTCVKTVPGLDSETIEQIQEKAQELLKEEARKKREAKAKAKRAMQEAEVQEAIERFDNLFMRNGYNAALQNGSYGWLPPDQYAIRQNAYWVRCQKKRALRLKTPKGQLKRLTGLIKCLEQDLGIE